ncbi:hypothetical protein GMRT_13504 [Giardia muris]|uniref:Uncharacterized protein n=1 Tax=Giardia muris TaxID=5742 RepID=A0A4Z1T203_GIAMU|nr:hypothetical protein GMRT_13504 [Giardia muris]|eukprot:TNJ27983.1 hypothetical protein GMRT_13504 [Giardia muris]
MNKVKRPPHIALREHARALGALERQVVHREKDIAKAQALLEQRKRYLANIPNLEETVEEKKALIAKHGLELDATIEKLETAIRDFSTMSIDDRKKALEDSYQERIDDVEKKLEQARTLRESLEKHHKELMDTRLLLEEKKELTIKAYEERTKQSTDLQSYRQKLEDVAVGVYTQLTESEGNMTRAKRAYEKEAERFQTTNSFLLKMQAYLRTHTLPILHDQVSTLLEDFKAASPKVLEVRAEALKLRREYIKAANLEVIKYPPLEPLLLGEGTRWEMLNTHASTEAE